MIYENIFSDYKRILMGIIIKKVFLIINAI